MSRFLVATTGHAVPLAGGETCVGTDPAVQIPVRAEMGLMPRHFVIVSSAGGCHLSAFDGALVLVNGLPVRHAEIHDGDQIVAGQLRVTYRDKNEEAKAMPSGTPNSFPFPQMGMPLHAEAQPERSPVMEAERDKPPQFVIRAEAGDGASIARRKQDHGAKMVIGLVLIIFGGLIAKQAFFDPSGPLKPEDIVITIGHITGLSVHGRKSNQVKELRTDLGLPRIIELPDDLQYNPDWHRPGSVAKIGFERAVFDNKKLNLLGTLTPLKVATLEVNGTVYRSLAKHNAEEESQNRLYARMGPGMVLGGVLLMLMGWVKGQARRRPGE